MRKKRNIKRDIRIRFLITEKDKESNEVELWIKDQGESHKWVDSLSDHIQQFLELYFNGQVHKRFPRDT